MVFGEGDALLLQPCGGVAAPHFWVDAVQACQGVMRFNRKIRGAEQQEITLIGRKLIKNFCTLCGRRARV